MKPQTPSKTLIYGLIDPETLRVHYIGRSSSGLQRPQGHMTARSLKVLSPKNDWLRGLIAAGLRYDVAVLECVDPLSDLRHCWWWTGVAPSALNDAERWWIAYGRACGWPLTNLTDGGEGNGVRRSEETRRKLSEIARNRTQEHRARLGAAHRGKRMSDDHRARITGENSASKRPDVRAKMSAAHMGRPYRGKGGRKHTDETKARISAALTGRIVPAETRERNSRARRGTKLTIAHRANISAGLRGNANARGRTLSADHRKKIGDALRGRKRG